MRRQFVVLFCIVLPVHWIEGQEKVATEPPLSAERQAAIHKELDAAIASLSEDIAKSPKSPKSVSLYMARGTALFHRGRFKGSVADFDKTIELEPRLMTSHWQRGIALYYTKQYEESAKQFEAYHSFDNVDRENGIWRFLAQSRAYGLDKAREGLLKYEKDDREPFPDIYAMFAGQKTADEILKRIRGAKISDTERDKRLFYANLYIGLYQLAQSETALAKTTLRDAVANPWGQQAGGGPGYMWHVGRVQYDELTRSDRG